MPETYQLPENTETDWATLGTSVLNTILTGIFGGGNNTTTPTTQLPPNPNTKPSTNWALWIVGAVVTIGIVIVVIVVLKKK